jgi:hypothetical protein
MEAFPIGSEPRLPAPLPAGDVRAGLHWRQDHVQLQCGERRRNLPAARRGRRMRSGADVRPIHLRRRDHHSRQRGLEDVHR